MELLDELSEKTKRWEFTWHENCILCFCNNPSEEELNAMIEGMKLLQEHGYNVILSF